MLTFGSAPILECSSKGDKRFSALYARIKRRDNKTIELLYQNRKMFPGHVWGLTIKDAKGKLPVNIIDCRNYYRQLWDEYIKEENPGLLIEMSQYNGFSDIFGQPNHACQAEEIYRIAKECLTGYG